MKRLFLLAALCAASLNAQHLSVGVIGGVPFTDVVSSYTSNTFASLPTSSNFIVGPSVQVNLPVSLRLEFDALYRPYSFSSNSGASGRNAGTVSASDWNFPVLMQYRFNTPVMEAGFSFDHLASLSAAAQNITAGPGTLQHQTTAGVVLGGGVDVKIPFVRLSGELRYTRQTWSDFQQISNLNQAEFLLGVHF